MGIVELLKKNILHGVMKQFVYPCKDISVLFCKALVQLNIQFHLTNMNGLFWDLIDTLKSRRETIVMAYFRMSMTHTVSVIWLSIAFPIFIKYQLSSIIDRLRAYLMRLLLSDWLIVILYGF